MPDDALNTGKYDAPALDGDRAIVTTHLDELYNQVWLYPGMGVGVKGGTVTPTEDTPAIPTGSFAAEKFLDANDSRYTWNIGVRSLWRNHNCDATFWYTSDVGSTNNFRIQLLLSTMQEGLPVNTFPLNSTASYPGPAVANTVMKVTVTGQLAPFTIQTDKLLSFLFRRIGADAADTNVNACILLAVMLNFYRN